MCCSLTSELVKTIVKLHTESERLNLETFPISKVPLSRPVIYDNLLTINHSTETLGLLPLASILLSGMHYFV